MEPSAMRLHHLIRRARIATIARHRSPDVGVRFRSERTVAHSQHRRHSRLPRKPAAAARPRRSAACRSTKPSGWRSSRTSASRSSGSTRRFRTTGVAQATIVLGAAVQHDLLEARRRRSSRRSSLSGSAHEHRQRHVRQRSGLEPDAALGRELHRRTGTTRGSRRTDLFNTFSPQLSSNLNAAVHAAAAAQLLDRSDSAAGRDQPESCATCRTSSSIGVITADDCERSRTRTGISRTRSTT